MNGLRAKRARNRLQSRIGTLLLHLLLLLLLLLVMTSGVVGVPELGGEVRQMAHVLLHDEVPSRRSRCGGGRGANRAPDWRLAGSLVMV